MANKEISSIRTMKSKITPKTLTDIMKKYEIDPQFHPRFPDPGNAIVDAPEGFVGVYRMFFKSGLRLPSFGFLKIVLYYYNLHISQITPNGFRKIVCFVMLCSALDIAPSITIFRHFYVPMSNRDWVSLFLHHRVVEIYDGLLTSIKYWKEEFFFVNDSAFSEPMAYGVTFDRVVNPSPELSLKEQSTADCLLENFVKWIDPKEVMLDMAGIISHWKKLGKKLLETLAGLEVTLLERLHRKRLSSSIMITEEATLPNSPFLVGI
ncbi:unnamed protein product [Lactuca virosa]|uniref:Transposase (putative) gypsy type domain-containing protein n=1 Tax=Lactuca virosa TaxID=75947 RepID=A0AAU9MYL1_9ASTR|nr:unnamed protein product [Lactuca virosa]